MKTEAENPWTILASNEIYENKWIHVTEFDVLNPSGGKGIYGKIHFKNLAIGIIALDEQNNTWLVGQFRFPLNAYSWEIPEGGCPEGEDSLLSAQRELLEETGITALNWKEIQKIHLSNSVCDELGIIYLAKDLRFGLADPEETEQLSVKKLPFSKAFEMVMNGEITDSMSVAGIQKLRLMGIA